MILLFITKPIICKIYLCTISDLKIILIYKKKIGNNYNDNNVNVDADVDIIYLL